MMLEWYKFIDDDENWVCQSISENNRNSFPSFEVFPLDSPQVQLLKKINLHTLSVFTEKSSKQNCFWQHRKVYIAALHVMIVLKITYLGNDHLTWKGYGFFSKEIFWFPMLRKKYSDFVEEKKIWFRVFVI
jgi:hypothetical protein